MQAKSINSGSNQMRSFKSKISLPDIKSTINENKEKRKVVCWKIKTNKPGTYKVRVSYPASNIYCVASHNITINENETKSTLSSSVNIINNTERTFENARIRITAFDEPKPENNYPRHRTYGGYYPYNQTQPPKPLLPKTFIIDEYVLNGTHTINSYTNTYIKIQDSINIPSKIVYFYRAYNKSKDNRRNDTYTKKTSPYYGSDLKSPVNKYLKFTSLKGLKSLIEGQLKIFKNSGKNNWICNYSMEHTPINTDTKFYYGETDGIQSSRRPLAFRVIENNKIAEELIELTFKNDNNKNISLNIVEDLYRGGNWEIMESNTEHTSIENDAISFNIVLSKNSEKTITYTVRYKW